MPYYLRTDIDTFWRLRFGTPPFKSGLSAQFDQQADPDFYWVSGEGAYISPQYDHMDAQRIFYAHRNNMPQEIATPQPIGILDPHDDEARLQNGWIDPAGNFYPVISGKHLDFLELCLGLVMETRGVAYGWVHVSENAWYFVTGDKDADKKYVTGDQQNTLIKLGRSPDERQSGYRPDIQFTDVVPDWDSRKDKTIAGDDFKPLFRNCEESDSEQKEHLFKVMKEFKRLSRVSIRIGETNQQYSKPKTSERVNDRINLLRGNYQFN